LSVLIIPAIDLKDGRCVRLQQGRMDSATVFSDDPVAMARHWAGEGAKRLHIVDLNGAVAGRPKNEKVIRDMIAAVGDRLQIQLGGGIRDLDTIESYLDAGVTYIVVGTAAVKNPGFLSDACYAFPGHVIAGLDAKEGKVAVEGWSKMTGHDVVDLAKKFEEYGIEALVYTDIGRDGMLTGINIEATLRLAQATKTPIIASGGLNSVKDVQTVCEKLVPEGIIGAIAGRALYEGKLDLKKAQAAADKALAKE
jgi:phosphoribosylformimino-5-aminoimidazole carboxamide ribotide isomerase